MSSIVQRLTEGVVNRDMRAESHALLSKWKKTGLLEGIECRGLRSRRIPHCSSSFRWPYR